MWNDMDVDVDIWQGKIETTQQHCFNTIGEFTFHCMFEFVHVCFVFSRQVKIRGMRVELGEIESGVVKAAAGLLSNCAVKLREGGFLVAYCQARCHV